MVYSPSYMDTTATATKTFNAPSITEIKKICKKIAGDDREKQMLCVAGEELENGFRFVKNHPNIVTFLGSARTKPDDVFYERTVSLAKRIVDEFHFSIATGGGPGIMEAANKGAKEAGGASLGMSIALPSEQKTNPYVTEEMDFKFFFIRKVIMCYSARAYIFFPGGLGTLNEFFEIMTLLQTKKMPPTPIFLYGSEFWKPLESYLQGVLEERAYIDDSDDHLYLITDSEDEIVSTLKRLM